MTFRETILVMLLQGPASGLQIYDRLNLWLPSAPWLVRTYVKFRLALNSHYGVLRDFEREGLVTSHEEPGGYERGYRPRRIYTPTNTGQSLGILLMIRPSR